MGGFKHQGVQSNSKESISRPTPRNTQQKRRAKGFESTSFLFWIVASFLNHSDTKWQQMLSFSPQVLEWLAELPTFNQPRKPQIHHASLKNPTSFTTAEKNPPPTIS